MKEKRYRRTLMCTECKHRTLTYVPALSSRMVGCGSQICLYERRRDPIRESLKGGV